MIDSFIESAINFIGYGDIIKLSLKDKYKNSDYDDLVLLISDFSFKVKRPEYDDYIDISDQML